MFDEKEKKDEPQLAGIPHKQSIEGPQPGVREDEPCLAEAKTSRHGELGDQVIEYYHINSVHQEIIRRLSGLSERLYGPNPNKEQRVERPEPEGLIDGMRQMNTVHQEDLETMLNIIHSLEKSL